MASRKKLTDSVVAKMRCPEGKSGVEITDVGGLFSVWCGPKQAKWFRYRYRFNGKTNRITLGQFNPDGGFGCDEARATVAHYELLRSSGHDPKHMESNARKVRHELTVGDVLDHHLNTLNEATRYNVGKLFKDIREAHGATLLTDFTPAVAKTFIETNYEHRQGGARTLVRNLVAAFNKALSPHSGLDVPPGYLNPFRDVRKAIRWWGSKPVQSHARNFEEAEWQAIFRGIRAAYGTRTNKQGIRIIELMLATGARPEEICSLRYDEIHVEPDGRMGWIDKKKHKMAYKGKPRRIWLMGEALEVINAAKADNDAHRYKGEWLFPQRRQRKDQRKPFVSNVNHYMAVVERGSKLKITPYSLRGAYVSFALDTLGIEWLEMVSHNVGHADPTITLRHYRKHRDSKLIDAHRKVVEAMERLRAA